MALNLAQKIGLDNFKDSTAEDDDDDDLFAIPGEDSPVVDAKAPKGPTKEQKLMDVIMGSKSDAEKAEVAKSMAEIAKLQEDIKKNPDDPKVAEDAKNKLNGLVAGLPDDVKGIA